MFTSQELLRFASRDYILENTTLDEQIAFVEDQIRDPFNSGNNNYFKKLNKMVSGQDEMDELCKQFFIQMQDVYTNLEINVDEYDQHLMPLCSAIYKLFVKNASELMYTFIRAYIYNNKNRKGLISEFSGIKISSYPKEQYGKKDYYILITRLSSIVDMIFEDGIKLKKFIEFIEKSGNDPVYLDRIKSAMDVDIIVDKGVVSDMFKLYKESDTYRSDLNKLEMDLTQTFIVPYLKDNGMEDIWYPPVEMVSDNDEDEEDDDEMEMND